MSSKQCLLVISWLFLIVMAFYLRSGIRAWQNLGKEKTLLEKVAYAPVTVWMVVTAIIGLILFFIPTGVFIWEIFIKLF